MATKTVWAYLWDMDIWFSVVLICVIPHNLTHYSFEKKVMKIFLKFFESILEKFQFSWEIFTPGYIFEPVNNLLFKNIYRALYMGLLAMATKTVLAYLWDMDIWFSVVLICVISHNLTHYSFENKVMKFFFEKFWKFFFGIF